MKKWIIKSASVLIVLLTLFTSFAVPFSAVPTGQMGNLPSTTETAEITINKVGSGYLQFENLSTGDYRINGNTALCNYSAGRGITSETLTTTKYILGNNTLRAKIMYYLTPIRGNSATTPTGLKEDLPSNLKGRSYLWLYQQLSSVGDYSGQTQTYTDWRYNEQGTTWFQTNKINTYEDILKAALYYQRGSTGKGITGEQSRDSNNQFVVVHALMDYVQHGKFTTTYRYTTVESAAKTLYRFMKKYETDIPAVPQTARVFIIDPHPGTNYQSFISIEYFQGYFKLEKRSANSNITNGNSYYSLSGAEYSWYKTRDAAMQAAQAVANGNPVPQDSNYLGYSITDSNGDSTTMFPKGSTKSVGLYPLGNYYLVETKAPSGFELSRTIKELTISTSNTVQLSGAKAFFTETPKYGSLTIMKSSGNTSVTDNNSVFTLSGAEYTVYKGTTIQNANEYTVLNTDANGHAYLNKIPYGTYFVKETKAPKGFNLDATIYPLTISSTHSSVNVSSLEPIQYVEAPTLLIKQDADNSNALEGAKFLVEYFDKEFDAESYRYDFVPKKRWLFKTDGNGRIVFDVTHLATSYVNSSGQSVPFNNDLFYYPSNGSTTAILPLGTIKITEVEAPEVIKSDGNRYKYKLDSTPTFRTVIVNSNNTAEYKTVTLKNVLEGALTKTIEGEKTWIDNENADGIRPDEITITLYKTVNGVETIVGTTTTNEEKGWKYHFVNQPITETINGVEYPVTYRVEEQAILGYRRSYNGYDIINTELYTRVQVTKEWDDNDNQDGVRPSNIIVRLYKNGTYTGKYASLSEENKWTYTFTEIPMFVNGKFADYTLEEDPILTSEGTYITQVKKYGSPSTCQYIELKNILHPAKTSVVVKKKWTDDDDIDGVRPSSVQVKLTGYVDGNVVFDTSAITMTAKGNATDNPNVWLYTFEGLDKYRKGKLIDYVATEITLVKDYNLDENGEPQTITAPLTIQEDGSYACVLDNKHKLKTTNIDVTKVWNDEDNRDGLRPESVTVYLMTVDENDHKTRYIDKDGNEVSEVLEESSNWVCNFSDLPLYDNNRQLITYAVEEIVPPNYIDSYSGDPANGFTITNTHKERTSVTVNKVWDDANDQDGIRPDSVTVNLFADGVKIDETELSAENDWSYTFDDLYVNQNGTPIKYTVIENDITVPSEYTGLGYATRYSHIQGTAETGFWYTITNVHTPETREIDVSKIWNDSNNADGIRPDQVEVKLSVKSPSNTGIADKYGYMSEETNWQYTFKNLPKYYNGTLIRYTVTETPIVISVNSNGYTSSVSGNMEDGFTITNTHQTERIRVIIDKVWDDDDDSAHMRPSTATFEITGYQGEVSTVILSEANNWHYSKTYNKYYNGVVQEPVVKEIALPEGYVGRKVVTVNRPSGSRITTYQYTWTNTYEPEPTTIPVKKVWNDSNDYFGQRPEGIIVQLFARNKGTNDPGSPRGSITLSDENDWQGSFNGQFPRYSNGIELEYFIKEYSAHYVEEIDPDDGMPTGNYILLMDSDQSAFNRHYIQKIEGDSIEGFTITNTHELYRSIDVPFKKIWNDDGDRDRIRPNSLDIVLVGYIGTEDGTDFENAIEVSRRYATVTASNNWRYTFRDLPAQCSEALAIPLVGEPEDYSDYSDYSDHLSIAREIWYKIEEINVPDGYEQTLTDFNRRTDDSYEYQTNFSTTYFNYYTTEVLPYSGSLPLAFGLVNEHTTEKTCVTVNKIWDDANNQDGVRPSSLKVNLLADGVKVKDATLSDTNGWSFTFSNLNANSNGQPITYTVTEDSIPAVEGHNEYEQTNVEIEGNTKDGWSYTFTNRLEPESTHVNVVKQWQDSKNLFGLRPSRLTITLKADGVAVQTYSMTIADEDASAATSQYDVWKYTFDNLPKYKNGVEIEYTVEETLTKRDSKNYRLFRSRSSTDSNGYKTFTFNNRHNSATISLRKNGVNNKLLEGAVFELYFIDGTPLKVKQIVDERYQYSPNDSSATNRITLGLGEAYISNLPPDAVIVAKEVVAPEVYAPYPEDIVIDIPQTIKDNDITVNNSGVYTLPFVTVNNSKIVMPSTGGFGDYTFNLLACASFIGSLIFLILKKRKDNEV